MFLAGLLTSLEPVRCIAGLPTGRLADWKVGVTGRRRGNSVFARGRDSNQMIGRMASANNTKGQKSTNTMHHVTNRTKVFISSALYHFSAAAVQSFERRACRQCPASTTRGGSSLFQDNQGLTLLPTGATRLGTEDS